MYCCSYRLQDLFFATYQGENLLHGLATRYEESGVDMFGLMHVLFDYDSDIYKVVGVFIFPGQDVPAKLAEMPDYADYSFSKVDPADEEVRTFLTSLYSGKSPLATFNVVSSKYFLG